MFFSGQHEHSAGALVLTAVAPCHGFARHEKRCRERVRIGSARANGRSAHDARCRPAGAWIEHVSVAPASFYEELVRRSGCAERLVLQEYACDWRTRRV